MKRDQILDKEVLPTLVDKELLYHDSYWRVKIFELNGDNIWTDCGTGQANIAQQVIFK